MIQRKKIIIVTAALIYFISLFAITGGSNSQNYKLVDGNVVPGPLPPKMDSVWPQVNRYNNVVYGHVDGYGDLLMDIGRPVATLGRAVPCAVWIHGGWWIKGSKGEGLKLGTAQMMFKLGFAVVSINYRLAPKWTHPSQINDCKLAVRFLRANCKKYVIDPNKIGVFGNSAGGHLSTMLGVADEKAGFEGKGYNNVSSRPGAVVEWSGIEDLTVKPWSSDAYWVIPQYLGCDPTVCKDKARLASPVTYATSDDPPIMVIHGDADEVVDYSQGQIIAKALTKVCNKGCFIRDHNGNHSLNPYTWKVEESPDKFHLYLKTVQHFIRWLDPKACYCDLNLDGKVDKSDAAEMEDLLGVTGFGKDGAPTDIKWNPIADVDGDGRIGYPDWQAMGTKTPVKPFLTCNASLTPAKGVANTFKLTMLLANTGKLPLSNMKFLLTLSDGWALAGNTEMRTTLFKISNMKPNGGAVRLEVNVTNLSGDSSKLSGKLGVESGTAGVVSSFELAFMVK